MTPEARALARALLDHRRRARSAGHFNVDACLIAYGDVCAQADVAQLKAEVGKFLREIAEWCAKNGWPPLNSLAVNHATRWPGRGYDNAPGCSLAQWRAQARACIEFDGYPDKVP